MGSESASDCGASVSAGQISAEKERAQHQAPREPPAGEKPVGGVVLSCLELPDALVRLGLDAVTLFLREIPADTLRQ